MTEAGGTFTWNNGTAIFYPGGIAPQTDVATKGTDVAQFGNGGSLASVATVNVGTQSIAGLIFGGTATNGYTLTNTGASVLTVGLNGITMNSGAQATSVGSSGALSLALSGAQLWQNQGTNLLTIAGNIDHGANLLTLGGAGSGGWKISGVIGSGATVTGGVTISGSTLVTLSGANLYSGPTAIGAGTILLAENNSALGATASGTTVASGGELQLSSALSTMSIGNEPLFLNGTGTTGTAGALHSLGGTKTYAGTVTLQSASLVTADAGTLTLSNSSTAVTGSFDLTLGGAATINVSGPINTGAGLLIKTGAGTAVLSFPNTYTGATVVNQGVLQIENNQALGTAATGTTINSGGQLKVNTAGTVTVSDALFLNGTGPGNTGAVTVIGGTGILSGPIVLQSDTVMGPGGATLKLDSTTPISGNFKLSIFGAGTTTIASSLNTGSGGLSLNSGTLILNNSAPSSYAGSTAVSGGMLQVGVAGVGSTGDGGGTPGAVTASVAGKISGSGVVSGPATFSSGAQLLPGDNGGTSLGRLDFGAGLVMNSGTSASFTISSPSNLDSINVSGPLTLNHPFFIVSFLGYTPSAGQTLDLMDWTGAFSGAFSTGGGAGGLRGGGVIGDLSLPSISSLGLQYNVSNFLTNGTIVIVPEPGAALLVFSGLSMLGLQRRRRRHGGLAQRR